MKITKTIIDAVKAAGHDRIVIHETGVYSCKRTPTTEYGQNGTKMGSAAIIYSAKIMVPVDFLYLTAPYTLIDLKND